MLQNSPVLESGSFSFFSLLFTAWTNSLINFFTVYYGKIAKKLLAKRLKKLYYRL